MNRRTFGALLLALGTAGCDMFPGVKKTTLPGERLPVLGVGGDLQPDGSLASMPVVLPAPETNADWPEPGGNPAHAMGHPALSGRLARAWATGVGEGSSRHSRVMAPPVVAGGRVFAMDGNAQITAVDAAGGNRVWQVDLTPKDERGSAFGGGPCFSKDRLYVGTGFAEIAALNPGDGKILWRKAVSAPVHAPPTVVDGRVFAVTVENRLEALSADDGHSLWSHSGIPETAGLLGGASPAVEGEVVVAAYSSGELWALSAGNGRAVWSDNLAAGRSVNAISGLADIRGRPVIDRGRVFAVSHSGRMAAIDLRTGDRVWELEIASSGSPWVVGDYVFVMANDNQFVCVTRNDGKIRWVRPVARYEDEKAKSDPIYWAGPVLGGEWLIAVSSNGHATSVTPETGQPIGQMEISSSAYVAPIIAGNTLYVLTDDANLTAYR